MTNLFYFALLSNDNVLGVGDLTSISQFIKDNGFSVFIAIVFLIVIIKQWGTMIKVITKFKDDMLNNIIKIKDEMFGVVVKIKDENVESNKETREFLYQLKESFNDKIDEVKNELSDTKNELKNDLIQEMRNVNEKLQTLSMGNQIHANTKTNKEE